MPVKHVKCTAAVAGMTVTGMKKLTGPADAHRSPAILSLLLPPWRPHNRAWKGCPVHHALTALR